MGILRAAIRADRFISQVSVTSASSQGGYNQQQGGGTQEQHVKAGQQGHKGRPQGGWRSAGGDR
jgi:hypothetical protein